MPCSVDEGHPLEAPFVGSRSLYDEVNTRG